MTTHRFIFTVLFVATLTGCGKSVPDPVGVWTVRHELKHKGPQTAESSVDGFSASTITMKDNGRFQEILRIHLYLDWDPDPTEYNGTWRQDDDVIRFKRDGGDATESYVIDEQGIRMTGNVAGQSIVMTKDMKIEEVVASRPRPASTPVEFGRSILELLAANNVDEFMKFAYISKEEFEEAGGELHQYSRMQQRGKEYYTRTRYEATVFASCDLESAKVSHFGTSDFEIPISEVMSNPFSSSDLEIYITESGKRFCLALDDCIFINGRWYIGDRLKGFRLLEQRSIDTVPVR
jgi:hypothetical protein